MRNRKTKLIVILLCLCLLTACGGQKETAAETPAPAEVPAAVTPTPETPDLSETLAVSDPEEIKAELSAAMEQPRRLFPRGEAAV